LSGIKRELRANKKALEQNQHRNMDLKRVDMVDHKSAVPSAIGIMEILPATATTHRPKRS